MARIHDDGSTKLHAGKALCVKVRNTLIERKEETFMKVKVIPGPRNEELIEKVAQTQGNAEAIGSLWNNEDYSPSAVLDSLFYAANDERLKLKIREDHLEQWLYDELYDWLPEYLNDWVMDESNA